MKLISSLAVRSSKKHPRELKLIESRVFLSNKHMFVGYHLLTKILKIWVAKYATIDILNHSFVLLFHNIMFNLQFYLNWKVFRYTVLIFLTKQDFTNQCVCGNNFLQIWANINVWFKDYFLWKTIFCYIIALNVQWINFSI